MKQACQFWGIFRESVIPCCRGKNNIRGNKQINRWLLMVGIFLFSLPLFAQRVITFSAKDGLLVTADLYESDPHYPYIVLFHQAGASRGEYRETAPKFMKLGYNCMAVDLRSGGEINFVVNETAARAREQKLSTTYLDVIPDMQAAIEFAANISRKPVIIVGSSYSASLALILATKNPQIKAVIAFSPGEYFGTRNVVRDTLSQLNIPLWIGGTRDELPYLKELTEKINPSYVTLFTPTHENGKHGSIALWPDNPSKDEYWFSLMLFFNQIKE